MTAFNVGSKFQVIALKTQYIWKLKCWELVNFPLLICENQRVLKDIA